MGLFLLFEVFSACTYIVIPPDHGTGPWTSVTVSPLCFRQQTLLNSALQACGLNSFTPARTVPSPAIIFPPLFINKHSQRKFTGRKVSENQPRTRARAVGWSQQGCWMFSTLHLPVGVSLMRCLPVCLTLCLPHLFPSSWKI